MKQALVTGGCGFVGRHVVRALRRQGVEVTTVDDFSTGYLPAFWPRELYAADELPNTTFDMDVRKFFGMSAGPYDTIFHCAAVVGGRLKIENDPLAVATDLAIDSEFFNWVVRLNPQPNRVVYFSSSAVYPVELQTRQQHVALSESLVNFDTTRIGRPDLTYGWSKLSGEYLAQIAVRKYGLPVVIYRPFSGYGEDQDLSYPFPALLKRIVEHEDPIKIWGSGEQLRDFIHIDDVIEAVFTTMHEMEPGEVMNLGSGVGTSFNELVKQAYYLTSYVMPRVDHDRDKPEGVFARVADVWKLSRFYKPKVSLEEGILRLAKHLDRTREKV